MGKAIRYGIGDRRFSDDLIPCTDGKLTGDDLRIFHPRDIIHRDLSGTGIQYCESLLLVSDHTGR
ncbi:MAG: hypothetical protein WD492_01125 [Alkalispirochaeta sp.]